MILNHPNLMCTAVPQPREWEMDGNKGVSYKIELSDGSGTVQLPCINGDVWKVFEPFKVYAVSIEVVQQARSGFMGVRARVVSAAVSQGGK